MSTTKTTAAGLARPTPEQTEHLAHWMALALERMPYFAPILYGLRPLHAAGMETFGVDNGMRLYVDFDLVKTWGAENCAQALLHECGHIWRNHHQRSAEVGANNPREHAISNVASDCEINDDLVAAGCTWLGEFGVMPAKIECPDNETFEFYLAALRQKVADQQQNQCGTCGQYGQPQPQPGGQPGDGQPCPDCGGEPGPYAGCGSVSGGTPAPCELPSGDDLNGQAPAATQVEKDGITMRTADAIVEHAKNRGNVPGSLLDQAKAMLTPPQVPWQRLLQVAIRASVVKVMGRKRTSYTRRNRRRHNVRLGGGSGERVMYPGKYSPAVNVLFVRDTSGSMSLDDLNLLGSEVVGIARSLKIKGQLLRVMDVDAVVHSVTPYRDVTSLTDISGRGGTDMRVGVEAAMALDKVPDVIVVGTDGHTPYPEVSPGVPVIVCIVSQSQDEAEQMADAVPAWATAVTVVPGGKSGSKAA